MKIRIEVLPKKIVVGKSKRMSLAKNKTHDLWQSFMTEKNQVANSIGTELYSIQVYDDPIYFKEFNPQTIFTKWAAIAVINSSNIPNGFETMTLESSLYAVFLHKGPANEFQKTMQFIFGEWLPKSNYALDNRPHFELLGKNYKNNDPDSEEEVWIPIVKKEELR